jgi:hypothetical protein
LRSEPRYPATIFSSPAISTLTIFAITLPSVDGLSSDGHSVKNGSHLSSSAPESGGPGPVSTAAADELRRAQDAAAAVKQRKEKIKS